MAKNDARAQLTEISSWRLEAKEEDSSKYFYSLPEVTNIQNGWSSYVIGRKGSGKTAVAEHINQFAAFDTSIKNLSFKSFPFNTLYEFEDQRFTTPSQYTTVWLYIIYCAICGMLADKDTLSAPVMAALRSHFSPGFSAALAERNKTSASSNFSFNILGLLSAEAGKGTDIASNEIPIYRRVEILEDLIAEHIDDGKYYVLFDELDEDYEDILDTERSGRYFELLTGLFKAVAAVRTRFRDKGVLPVIFLRDDIYSLIGNNDKNKWQDSALTLLWSEDSLQRLLAFRIMRAKDPSSADVNLADSFSTVFSVDTIRLKSRRNERREVVKFMLARTLMRPRDIVSYMRECARVALERDMFGIDGNVIKTAESNYSNRLRSEMVDEIQSIIPNIDAVFDVLSQVRKQILRLEEFEEQLGKVYNKLETSLPVETISEILFNFSVIGNVASQRSNRIFKYNHPRARLNRDEHIAVHMGLHKSLRLL